MGGVQQLPSEEITKDIHCETKWSKLDAMWEDVSVDVLLEEVETAAEYVTAFCDGDYTTNLPLEDVTGGKACGARYTRLGVWVLPFAAQAATIPSSGSLTIAGDAGRSEGHKQPAGRECRSVKRNDDIRAR